MSGGSRMIRWCMCDKYPEGSLEIHAPQIFCPLYSLRRNIRRRARAGDQLFPGLNGHIFTDRLKITARRCGLEKADRLRSHSIRRGAARAILDEGGSSANYTWTSG